MWGPPGSFTDMFDHEMGAARTLVLTGLAFDLVYVEEIQASGQFKTKEFCGWGVELHFLFHF